ncbi:hypothetical protein [Methanolobus profundi]|uniref:Uncharacterized protein n=1 Tax=Methanolobus profundi TaxID=487685 RepID=A0A1I4SBL0_9EURY|nr:hypothetical protein [Methanolobus profundi]SFM61673.1 hypothetical protein SAMN04488696_1875 [Methanolobus profundi]
MKYKIFLVAGITILTVMLLFLFSGAVAGNEAGLLADNGIATSEHGYGTLLLGIGIPLIIATLYVVARSKKSGPL